MIYYSSFSCFAKRHLVGVFSQELLLNFILLPCQEAEKCGAEEKAELNKDKAELQVQIEQLLQHEESLQAKVRNNFCVKANHFILIALFCFACT